MADSTVVTVNIDVSGAKKRLAGIKNGFRRALLGSVQRTRREIVTWTSREVRQRIAIKKEDIDKSIEASRPTWRNPVSRFILSKRARPSLARFGLRQKYGRKNRKTGVKLGAGVTYKISKAKGRQVAKRGFGADPQKWEKLGGHGFVRLGKARTPIVKLHGPSAWGVIVKNNRVRALRMHARRRLMVNMEDYVRFLLLKSEGKA